MTNQFFRCEIIGERLVAIKCEGATYAATFRPRTIGLSDACTIFWSAESMLRAVTPAVVDDSLLAHCVVIPRYQFCRMPLLSGVTPLAVGKDNRWTIFCNQLLELRNHVVVDIICYGIIWVDIPAVQRISPFRKRIIESHFKTFGTHCIGEFSHNVTLRSAHDAIPFWRIFAVPETISIVMFSDEKHVFRAALLE